MSAVPAPESTKSVINSVLMNRASVPLFSFRKEDDDGEGLLALLRKSDTPGSAQGADSGEKSHPFDFEAVTNFQSSNEHHATCIHTKTMATVGLGFRDSKKIVPPSELQPQKVIEQESKVDKALNAYCDQSFSDVLNDCIEDYWQVGNGYMEVVRNGSGANAPISGIFHIPAYTVSVFVEPDLRNYHYIVRSADNSKERRFARFGDRERFLAVGASATWTAQKPEETAEIISFRKPSSLSKWYGFPDWLSCVPSIELTQCLLQYNYDFFLNRGVPEFLLFVMGQKMNADDWAKIESVLRSGVGLGNSHKSGAFNIPNGNVEIQLEKLAIDGKSETGFGDMADNLGLRIVTAHKVPPLLAGIQIPGKLGATNELPNALMAFQTLQIGPTQRNIQQRLSCTLGNSSLNGGLGLGPEDFYFRKITEEIDLGTMDTVGRMRETVPEAKAKGRNPKDGLKD